MCDMLTVTATYDCQNIDEVGDIEGLVNLSSSIEDFTIC